MTLSKPRPGQDWHPSAARDGQTADAVNWVQQRQRDTRPGDGGPAPDPDRCLIQNGTCADFDQYDAVELDSSVIRPADNLPAWEDGIQVFRGVTPRSANARIAVLQEPLPSCGTRRAIVSGLTRAKVLVSDESHRWATVAAGSRRLVSTSNSNAPAEIIWKESGTGERYADLLLSTRRSAAAATSTSGNRGNTPGQPLLSDCTGQGKWVWSVSLGRWIPVSNTCGTRTPTTTTTGEPTSTTTPGESDEPCCPFAATEADLATTTPGEPTSTTTPGEDDDCEPLYPNFCGTADGQCTYTSCSRLRNTHPVCEPGTTTTPQPCDCETVETPPQCTAGCDWVAVPTSTGGWTWHRASNGCSPGCPCEEPESPAAYCATTHTDCVIPEPPIPPGAPGCSGECVYTWIPALGRYWLGGFGCDGAAFQCGCSPPSGDGGEDCEPVRVPCGAAPGSDVLEPPATTTPEFDPCVYVCLGQSPPQPPETRKTCQTGGGLWKWDTSSWTLLSCDCPSSCPCSYPSRDGQDDCEVVRTGCAPPPPPTTTTPEPTSTTTDECADTEARLKCTELGDVHVWAVHRDCPAGFYRVMDPCSSCDTNNTGQVCCAECHPTTTTTTTEPPATTTNECSIPCNVGLGICGWQCSPKGDQWIRCSNCPEGQGCIDDPPLLPCIPCTFSGFVDCQFTTTTTPEPTTTTTPGELLGACCYGFGGEFCLEDQEQEQCEGVIGGTWHVGQTCAQANCGG